MRAPFGTPGNARTVVRIALPVLGLLASPPASAIQDQAGGAGKVILAASVAEPPLVDGDLSDDVWDRATPVTDFLQQEPTEGGIPSEETEVRILYTSEALFLGIRCLDSQVADLRATERRRDASLDSDDAFWFVLDTAHDRRNSYFFQTNPLGTQWDALVSDEGKLENQEWDGRWEVAARIESWGWAAEVQIPFSTLRIPDRDLTVWGIDFRRFIRRKNEVVSWSNYRRNYSFLEVSQAGDLGGLSELGGEHPLTIKPYAAGGVLAEDSDVYSRETDLDAGLEELRYGVTSSTTLNLTVNPDFAQAEVDAFRVNLTRFPLFFEEKREFFLEDAGLFEFGTGGEDLLLLHTRRIGLTEDREPIPILYGVRLSGQPAGWNLGVMNVQTRSEDDSPAQNYGVYRMKKDLFARSYMGVMSTSVLSDEAPDNVTLGVDGYFLFFENLSLESFFAGSKTESSTRPQAPSRRRASCGGGAPQPCEEPESEGAWGAMPLRIGWGTDLLEIQGEYLAIEGDFDPEAGFVERTDIREGSVDFSIGPRPDLSWLRQIELSAGVDYLTDMEGTLLTREQFVSFQLEMESGDAYEIELGRNLEFLDEPFHLADRILVEPGTYRNDGISFQFRPYGGRRASGFFQIAWEDFWGGRLFSIALSPQIRWSDRFITDIDYDLEDVSLPDGEFVSHVVNAVVHLNFTNEWLTSTTLQYSSLDEEWGVNFRLNYIYRTGDDIFFIINQVDTPEGNYWSVFAKFTHTFEI
jgi:hypothetical protein